MQGFGPAAIERNLKADPGLVQKGIPHIKTIQAIARENTPADPSAPWQLGEAGGEDAAIILPVLAVLIEASDGQLKAISNARAEWIMRLRHVAEDLPPWTIYQLAHVYMLRNERQDTTDDLDAFLAFAPWRTPEAAERYYATGAIPASFLSDVVPEEWRAVDVKGPQWFGAMADASDSERDRIELKGRKAAESFLKFRQKQDAQEPKKRTRKPRKEKGS